MSKKAIRKMRAKISRTFLADCPRCHGHFYGFNNHGLQLKFGSKNFRIVCHKCSEEHERILRSVA